MEENELRRRPPSSNTSLCVLGGITFFFALGSLLCWAWWKHQRDKVRDELTEAASRGAWDKYQAALRNEWPALDWFIASLIFLLLAVALGSTALFYWAITRRRRLKSSR